MTRAVVSREAYGVRGACSRCRMCGTVRKREQAPRTPYASRGLVPVMPAWGQTRPARPAFTEALPERDWRDWLALWHLFNYTVFNTRYGTTIEPISHRRSDDRVSGDFWLSRNAD